MAAKAMAGSENTTAANAGGGHAAVRTLLGGILLLAATLKGYQLATQPTAETSLMTSRWFLIAVVEFEVLLGLCLISGVFARSVWLVTLGCFALFAVVSLHKALSGEASCGCFGSVETNPWYTAALDVAAVIALLRWRPAGLITSMTPAEPKRPAFHYFALGGLWLVIAASAGWGMSRFEPAKMTDEGAFLGDSDIVVLEPENWLKKPFPLFAHIDIGTELSEGAWVVLLYHHDCPQCREVLPEYQRIAHNGTDEAIALVEVPPFSPTNETSSDGSVRRGRLKPTKDWFVQTPTEIRLEGGVVKAVRGAKDLESSRHEHGEAHEGDVAAGEAVVTQVRHRPGG